MFLDEMGLAEHQAIYALHRDTNNWHLHLAVNRVAPGDREGRHGEQGFDHEVAHRAIARIEQRPGLAARGAGRFLPLPGGDIERARPAGSASRQPSGRRARLRGAAGNAAPSGSR